MFIAINELHAKADRGEELEEAFGRPRGLEGQVGFISFELLKMTWGPGDEDVQKYLALTRWISQEDFLGWTKSQSFRDAHAGGRPDYMVGGGHPAGYEVCLSREKV